ncbi:hypothetical protein Patl1_36811 [Pistacia atlantica]|nr:hypothetical protein Patl1_36811 [Pistacia atlantica]
MSKQSSKTFVTSQGTKTFEPKLTHTESNHSVQITTIRLNEGNFMRWSQSVRMYIRGRSKIGYLTGETKAPDTSDPAYSVWDAKNFNGDGTVGELYGRRNRGESVTRYFSALKRLWQDLDLFNDYEWKSSDDFKHHKQIVEKRRIFKFLAGLDVEFDEVRGRIIGRKPLPTLE